MGLCMPGAEVAESQLSARVTGRLSEHKEHTNVLSQRLTSQVPRNVKAWGRVWKRSQCFLHLCCGVSNCAGGLRAIALIRSRDAVKLQITIPLSITRRRNWIRCPEWKLPVLDRVCAIMRVCCQVRLSPPAAEFACHPILFLGLPNSWADDQS